MPPFLLVHPHDHPIAVSPPGRKGPQGPGFGYMGTFRTRSMGDRVGAQLIFVQRMKLLCSGQD